MTIFEMLEQSTILTLLGMAVVFAFLWIMIIFIGLLGKIINRGKNSAAVVTVNGTAGNAVKPGVIAAITAAIAQYQKKG